MRNYALLYINGEPVEVRGEDAFMMLANWLRKRRMRTGTKIVCAEGDCGACSVLQAWLGPGRAEKPHFVAINSCIATVAQLDGSSIVTVEGLALGAEPSPVQNALTNCQGSQCGYCTPGFAVAMTALWEKHPGTKRFTEKQVLNALTGNLCRCTGYLPIMQAGANVKWDSRFSAAKRFMTPEIAHHLATTSQNPMQITANGITFTAPTEIKDALKALKPRAKEAIRILGGGTDLGVVLNKGKVDPTSFLSLHLIRELYEVKVANGLITIGARVSLERLRVFCEREFPEMARLLNVFASPQIKNTATLVGNVANGSPIGDTIPLLLSMEACVHCARFMGSRVATRVLPLSDLYLGYRKLNIAPGELITGLSFPLPHKSVVHKMYKASQREDLDISAVSASFAAALHKKKGASTLQNVRVAMGGVAATPIRVKTVEKILEDAPLEGATLERATRVLQDSIAPISDARGSASWRRVLAENFLRQFWSEISS